MSDWPTCEYVGGCDALTYKATERWCSAHLPLPPSQECVPTVDGWCATHSTEQGPVYCCPTCGAPSPRVLCPECSRNEAGL